MYEFEKMSQEWHYDRKVPASNELRKIGSVSISPEVISHVQGMIENPSKQRGIKRIHSGDTALDVRNSSINQRSAYMRRIGYDQNHYFFEFNDHPFTDLESSLRSTYSLSYDHSCAVIIPPGQCMPCHGDTYGYLQKCMKKDHPTVTFDLVKHARRYMVFLTDWSWGQSLGAGNAIKGQWEIGDMYEWDHRLVHWCSNSGFDPLVFFEISGLEL